MTLATSPPSLQKQTRYSLAQLAQALGAQLRLGHGASQTHPIEGLVHPKLAQGAHHLIYAASVEALQALTLGAAEVALIEQTLPIPDPLMDELLQAGCSFLVVSRSRLALATLLSLFEKPAHVEPGIHPTAIINPSATVPATCTVGPYAIIGPNAKLGERCILHAHVSVGANAVLGDDCLLHTGVYLGDRCELGLRVILQPNAVIGADGFSYVTPQTSAHEEAKATKSHEANTDKPSQALVRINSIGNVVLEDDVEVGAGACIDRGTLAETRIGRGTKIDNLAQIGHNNRVGQDCLIVSQVGMAGSCKIGNGVVLAGQVGLADHLTIGDGAIVMAQAGVMRDVEPGQLVAGTPALPKKQAVEQVLYTARLKEMHQSLKALKKQVAELEKALLEKTETALN